MPRSMQQKKGILTDADVAKIKCAAVETVTVDNGKFAMSFVTREKDAAADDAFTSVDANAVNTARANKYDYIKVVYKAGATDTNKNITIYIKLADDWQTNWTYVADNSDINDHGTQGQDHIGYFYYNKVLPAGGTTGGALVDSVILGSENKGSAYYEMNYDLSVDLDSVQIAKQNDTYTSETINTWVSDAEVSADGVPTWVKAEP